MRAVIAVILLLYVVALHCSIAAMETLGWLTFALVVGWMAATRARFHFPMARPLLALLVVTAVSVAFNPPLRPFLFQVGTLRWIFLLWAFTWALAAVWNEGFESRLIKVWTGAFLITVAYATFQFFTGLDPVHPGGGAVFAQGGGLYKAAAFFDMSLTYASTIGISFFALLVPVLGRKSYFLKVVTVIAGTLGVVVSMSKGAWMAALATGTFYVGSVRRRHLLRFAGAAAVLAGLLAWLSEPFREKIDLIVGLRLDHSAGVRVDLWRAYWAMFCDHPWLGVGILQGDKMLPDYYLRLGIAQDFTSHAHNVLLQWLAGGGVLSFGLYLWISVAFLRTAWVLRLSSPWGWSLFLSQIYFHLVGLVEANFFDGEVNHFLVFIWALTAVVGSRGISARPKPA